MPLSSGGIESKDAPEGVALAKFRISSVTIQGFKAFTSEKTVPINGRTTFIFGDNGQGKSSIIEAIVWCLYGTESPVRNELYRSQCGVDLRLYETSNPSRIWTIRRILHQTDNQSDPIVFTPEGTRKNISEVFPQMRKLEHGSGTRVIFAEQEPGRRYSHDTNKFEAMIAAYLGIDVFYTMIDWLTGFITAQEEALNSKLRPLLDALIGELEQRRIELQGGIRTISTHPPWDGQFPPSENETLRLAVSLLSGILSLLNLDNSVSPNLRLNEVLYLATERLAEFEQTSTQTLRSSLEGLNTKIGKVSQLRNELSQVTAEVSTYEQTVKTLESGMQDLLQGKTSELLQQEREQLEKSQGDLILQLQLMDDSRKLIRPETTTCPICATELQPGVIHAHLSSFESLVNSDVSRIRTEIATLDSKISAVSRMKEDINKNLTSISLRNARKSEIERELCLLLEITGIDLGLIGSKSIEMARTAADLSHKLEQGTVRIDALNEQLTKLQRMSEYHRLLRALAEIESFKKSEVFAAAQAKITEFQTFITSLEKIHDMIERAYLESIASHLPGINKELTGVYQALTHQKSFDLARIRMVTTPGASSRLLLEVGSSEREKWILPEEYDALNGQAVSVLSLLPFFAFAKMGVRSDREIEFLLIDDPSQSFDKAHVEYLLDLLSTVAKNSEIIVATHERNEFEPLVSSLFKSYSIITMGEFSAKAGPTFNAKEYDGEEVNSLADAEPGLPKTDSV